MSTKRYLDDNGLLYFWQKIKGYVSSIMPTKQSDLINDDNTVKDADYLTYKAKIDDLEQNVDGIIATGGEPNVIEGVAVNGNNLPINNKIVGLVIDSGLTNGTIAVNGSDIPVTGLGSAAYTASTAYDSAGAAASVLGNSSDTAGTTTVYGNKASIAEIMNAGYQTAAEVQSAIAQAVGDITGIEYEVVQSLPPTGEAGVIYLLANNGSNPNIYDEYIWYNSAYEKIGTTDVDLSNYLQTTDIVAITNQEIDTITAPSS